jgi:hypothetical protein
LPPYLFCATLNLSAFIVSYFSIFKQLKRSCVSWQLSHIHVLTIDLTCFCMFFITLLCAFSILTCLMDFVLLFYIYSIFFETLVLFLEIDVLFKLIIHLQQHVDNAVILFYQLNVFFLLVSRLSVFKIIANAFARCL